MGFLAAAAPYAAPIIGGLAGAAGSALGGAIGNQGNQETKLQKQRRKLIDQLVNSLRTGGGEFGDLFNRSEDDFQKGFVEPAKSRFNNQIAPMIQQQFVNSGLQRGTGLDDSLARAGVDLDQLINQNYLQFQQGGLDRKANLLNSIMGGTEAPKSMSSGQAAGQGFAGYLSSPGLQQTLNGFTDIYNRRNPTRSGYSNDWASQGAGAAGTFY